MTDARERIQIRQYVDLLAPDSANPHGGCVWRWVQERGGSMAARQDAGGPVYALVYTRGGVVRADIFDWIREDGDGFFSVRSPREEPQP